MGNFKKLKVWHEAHSLTLSCYKLTHKFPEYEKYALGDQIRRASASIPANIAEGVGTTYKKEFLRFLSIARGSSNEIEYFLILARDLEYMTTEEYQEIGKQASRVTKMLSVLIKRISDDIEKEKI